MRIVLRYYQPPLMYATRRVSDQWINTLNKPATSDFPISAHMVCEKCDEKSLFEVISLTIPLAYICTMLCLQAH